MLARSHSTDHINGQNRKTNFKTPSARDCSVDCGHCCILLCCDRSNLVGKDVACRSSQSPAATDRRDQCAAVAAATAEVAAIGLSSRFSRSCQQVAFSVQLGVCSDMVRPLQNKAHKTNRLCQQPYETTIYARYSGCSASRWNAGACGEAECACHLY